MLGGKNDFRSLRERYTLFTWSQPVGYDFSEVEETIDEYRNTISDMNELLIKKEEENDLLRAKLDDFTKEIVEMRMNMEAMTVPVYTPNQSIEILDNFKNAGTVVVESEESRPATNNNTKKQDLIDRQNAQQPRQQQVRNTRQPTYQQNNNQQQQVRRMNNGLNMGIIDDIDDDFYSSSASSSDIII